MLSKCANPSCPAPFHYLREGRLFQIETSSGGPRLVDARRPAYKVEYFWLCNRCATEMTLAYDRGKGVVAVPLPQMKRAAAS